MALQTYVTPTSTTDLSIPLSTKISASYVNQDLKPASKCVD